MQPDFIDIVTVEGRTKIPIFEQPHLRILRGATGFYQDGRIFIDPDLPADERLRTLRHELTHARQHARSGQPYEAWHREYMRLLDEYGYLNHPWEIEARRAERLLS